MLKTWRTLRRRSCAVATSTGMARSARRNWRWSFWPCRSTAKKTTANPSRFEPRSFLLSFFFHCFLFCFVYQISREEKKKSWRGALLNPWLRCSIFQFLISVVCELIIISEFIVFYIPNSLEAFYIFKPRRGRKVNSSSTLFLFIFYISFILVKQIESIYADGWNIPQWSSLSSSPTSFTLSLSSLSLLLSFFLYITFVFFFLHQKVASMWELK